MDGEAVELAAMQHLAPLSAQETAASHFPFGGHGARPPMHAGDVVELQVVAAAHTRSITVDVV